MFECFVCGEEETHHNIMAFVQCEASSKRIIAMFNRGVRSVPINGASIGTEVTVSACVSHRLNLLSLHSLTRINKGIITEEIVKEALSM